jgi:hypothetical protein
MATSKKDPAAETQADGRSIVWDDSKMDTSYANICNISSTREEIAVLFGTNLTWQSKQKAVTVELHDRIVMNPFVAKRLLLMLEATIKNYEKTVAPIKIEGLESKG